MACIQARLAPLHRPKTLLLKSGKSDRGEHALGDEQRFDEGEMDDVVIATAVPTVVPVTPR